MGSDTGTGQIAGQRATAAAAAAALIQAVLLYWLILPQGVLFTT